jgi:hypothetical protein
MPISCGTGGGGRRGVLLVAGGGRSREAPSSHPRQKFAAYVSLLGLQVRIDVTVRLRICLQRMVFTRTKSGAQAHLAPSSSDVVLTSWAGWTPRMRLSHARHSSCRRRASIKIFSFLLHSFSQRSQEHHSNRLEFPDRNALCSVLPFPYSLVLPLSRVSWVARDVQRSTKAHFRCICMHYSVGWERSN